MGNSQSLNSINKFQYEFVNLLWAIMFIKYSQKQHVIDVYKKYPLLNCLKNSVYFMINAKAIYLFFLDKFNKFTKFLTSLIMKKHVLKFHAKDTSIIKQWLVNHCQKFQEKNVFSISSSDDVRRYNTDKNIDDIIVYDPRVEGIAYFENVTVKYIMDKNSITLFSFDRTILYSVIEDITNNIINAGEKTKTEEHYKVKVYGIELSEVESTVNGKKSKQTSYNWKLNNTICEKVNLFMSENTEFKVINPFDKFYNNKELYHELGIAHKIAAVFKGSPGTGKTSTVKYIAQKHKKNIYMFQSLNLTPKVFMDLINMIPYNSIIFIDDVDKMQLSSQLSVTMLSLLDGANTIDGMCFIFSLNRDYCLEKNFPTISRPGRIDLNIDFDHLDNTNLERFAVKELFTPTPSEEEITEYLEKYTKERKKLSIIKNNCLLAERDIIKGMMLLDNVDY